MQDLRSAWRALRHSPVLSAAAILSLALGMGANTALFSVVDALLLRELPVREPDRLVTVLVGLRARSRFQGRRRHELRHLDAHAGAGPGDDVVRGRLRLGPRSRRSLRRGRNAARRCPVHERRVLHHARRPRLARADVHAGRRSAGRRPRGRGRRDQLPRVAASIQRRRRCHRHGAARRRRPVHGDWRHASGLLRGRSRAAVRRRPPPGRGADRPRRARLAAQSLRADVDRHVQARARTVGRRRRRQRCARCSRTFSGSPAPRRGSCRRC